jgi:hypothetical protein
MTRLLLAGIGLAAMAGLVMAQDKKVDDHVKVEIFLATEHVPKDVKAKTRVDLKMVTGKTVAPNGFTVYRASLVAANVEVASVTAVEKPVTPEGAMRVELLVDKGLASKIEKTRDHMVTVRERLGNGTSVRNTKPVTLRLELSTADKK